MKAIRSSLVLVNRQPLTIISSAFALIAMMAMAIAMTATPAQATTRYAYVPNSVDDTISTINLTTNLVTSTFQITPGCTPIGVAVNPNSTINEVYVLCAVSNQVLVLSTAAPGTLTLLETIQLPNSGTGPDDGWGIAVDPLGHTIYATLYMDTSTCAIDRPSGFTSVCFSSSGGGAKPLGVDFSHASTTAYIADAESNQLDIVSVSTHAIQKKLAVGTTPKGVVTTPTGSYVYVSNGGSASVSVVDTATKAVVATIPVGNNPAGIAITPDGTKVYVANSGSNTVSVISTATNTVTAVIAGFNFPVGVSVSPTGNEVLVANYDDGTISVVSIPGNTVTATITVGELPVAFGKFIK